MKGSCGSDRKDIVIDIPKIHDSAKRAAARSKSLNDGINHKSIWQQIWHQDSSNPENANNVATFMISLR